MTFKEAQELYKYIKDIPGGFDAVYEMMHYIEENCPSTEKERKCDERQISC
jgi:hypothetical protein